MTVMERTRQQLDPIGSLPARLLAVALSAGALAYGITMTIRAAEEIVNPVLAVLALIWLAGAAVTVAIASSSSRAPFTMSTHLVVQLLGLGAFVLATASQWGANEYVQDDFGPFSLGMLILAMGVYRPARELASAGAIVAVFVGFITLLEVPALVTQAPPVAFVLVGMTPVLALTFGAAAYSSRLVSELENWQRMAAESLVVASDRLTGGIARSVRLDRLEILDRDVFPFFSAILSRETVTAHDRVRAREIAESIRTLMVAEADRTWLEVVAREDGVAPDALRDSVADAGRRATGMLPAQRTALRALILALRENEMFVRGSLKVTITGAKNLSNGVLAARLSEAMENPLAVLGPYFAVMRVVFPELNVEYHENKLTVRFSYEQRRPSAS